MQREGVDTTGKLGCEELVDCPVPGDQTLAAELVRHQHYLEMAFRPSRYIMTATFVYNLQVLQLEAGIKLLDDDVLSIQAASPTQKHFSDYRPVGAVRQAG
jgi:hypothetical protein